MKFFDSSKRVGAGLGLGALLATASSAVSALPVPWQLNMLLLDPDAASGFARTWTPAVMPPARHQAYALQWFAFALAALIMIIGIPLFFEVGVVLLMPVILLMTRRSGSSIVRVGIPALAGLSVMHEEQ